MGDEKPKKQRASNFSHLETDLLCRMVVKYATVIESKQTDAVMWREKMDCWGKITNDFNSNNNGPPRTLQSLRTKYDTFKRKLRKKIADNKAQLYKTEGGPYTQISLTPAEEILYNIIFLSVDGLPARYDDDNNTNVQISGDGSDILVQSAEGEQTNSNEQDSFAEETIFIEVGSPSSTLSSSILSCDPSNKKSRVDKKETTFAENIQIQQHSPQDPSYLQNTWKPLKKPQSKELQTQRKRHLMTKMEAANKINTGRSKKKLVELQCTYLQETESKRQESVLRIETAEENLKAAKLDVEIKTLEKRI